MHFNLKKKMTSKVTPENVECALCLTTNKRYLIGCPVENNCNYVMCKKCIGKEKNRLKELDPPIRRMKCPACTEEWSKEMSLFAEGVSVQNHNCCPCYIVITHETDFIDDEPRVRTICSCYPNPGHCCHNTCQKIILGYNFYKEAVIHNSRCIYATFMAQKSIIIFCQIVLVCCSARALWQLTYCWIGGIEPDDFDDDWCEPYWNEKFPLFVFGGIILFVIYVFLAMIAFTILSCICCDHSDDD